MAWVKPALVTCAAIAFAGCNVTSDGSSGDPPSEPRASELGNGARLREVVLPADWYEQGNMESVDCDVPQDSPVFVTGQVIVGIDDFDETGDGALGNIYIQDLYEADETPLPYSGITVFGPAFTPPDLRVFEGDVVDTFGSLMEFLGPSSGRFGDCKTLPEIGGTLSFRFDHGPADPVTIVPLNGGPARFDPILGYQNARQWMGMLVRIEGVTIAGNPTTDGNGRFSAAINMGPISAEDSFEISNELFDVGNSGPDMENGTQFKAVSGVVTYFYGFKIAPRSIDDFEL